MGHLKKRGPLHELSGVHGGRQSAVAEGGALSLRASFGTISAGYHARHGDRKDLRGALLVHERGQALPERAPGPTQCSILTLAASSPTAASPGPSTPHQARTRMTADVLPPPLRIAVVGGGIAGLATALTVLKRLQDGKGCNVQLDVYEAATKFSEIGAGVGFGPNAQKALDMMGLRKFLAKLEGHVEGTTDPDLWFHLGIGEKDHPESGKVFYATRHPGAGRGSVHRADFLDLLLPLVPSALSHFRQRVLSYDTTEECITLHFDENSPIQTAVADVVIDASGIKSPLRECMYRRNGWDVEEQRARYAKWIVWRGLVSKAKFEAAMGKEVLLDSTLYCGEGRHLLHFSVRGGELRNIVAFVRDDDEKRLKNRTGPWTEYLPHDELLADFSTFREEHLEVLRAIDRPSIWGMFEMPELKTHVDDRFVLIGDAAHGTTPHQGAGAGQGVEDALFIGSILSDPAVTCVPLPQRRAAIARALKAYHDARYERGTKIVHTSREAGLLYEFRGLDGEGDSTAKMTEKLKTRMDWVWKYDTEAELEKALASLSV